MTVNTLRLNSLRILLPVAVAVVLGACEHSGLEDEIYADSASRQIRLGVSMSDRWTNGTRSSAPLNDNTTSDVVPMINSVSGDTLYLHAEITDYPDGGAETLTRSTIVASSAEMYDEIGVSAYYYTDKWDAGSSLNQPNYFCGVTASGSDGQYAFQPSRFWPASGKMRFLAYAPVGDPNYAFSGGFKNGTRGPYVEIKVPEKVEDQKDLLVAYTNEISCSGNHSAAPLNFKHAMTCIRFVCGSDMVKCRIKRINIKNVYSEGQFIFNMDKADESTGPDCNFVTGGRNFGYNTTKLGSFSQTLDYEVKQEDNDYIATNEASFIMLPQWLPNGAEVQIVLQQIRDDGSLADEEMIFGYINGKEWAAGKIITYRVSYDNWWQHLSVTELESFAPEGGEQEFRITSFDISNNDYDKRPAQWVAEFKEMQVINGQEIDKTGYYAPYPPAWLTLDVTSSDGDITPRTIKATVQPTEKSREIDMNLKLKNNASYLSFTKQHPYNLAAPADSYNANAGAAISAARMQNTANCYVVDGPGWYMFPLVYGNAIKDGRDNTLAYSPNAGSANGVLNNFINHLGNEITSPYILQNAGCGNPAGARMIWQDSESLVASVLLDKSAYGGIGGVIFYVSQANIRQGNATIGLMATASDDAKAYVGDAMWSWHIWVTPFLSEVDDTLKETIAVTNHTDNKYDVMCVNLGWCSYDPVSIYDIRKCRVRFTATTKEGKTKTMEIDVIQRPEIRYWHGYNPYYQWGRKDPFQPVSKDYNSKTWYDYRNWVYGNQYPKAENLQQGAEGLKNRILKPNYFHMVDEIFLPGADIPEGYDETFYNLWDATNTRAWENNGKSLPSRTATVKSVYDPCPPGYKVPPTDTFTGFTKTGNNLQIVEKPKNWNGVTEEYEYHCNDVSGFHTPHIFIFYTDKSKQNNIAMPSMGYRDWRNWNSGSSSTPLQMGTDGYYWTAGARDRNRGYYLCVMKDRKDQAEHVYPLNSYWHTDGYCIRPCKE